ncbi:MAG: hypothetical protein CME38_01360 [Haliea sp.]|nr:hypothetical protein [Haliea sp.]|tara:strand:+ start:1530 stop:1748 length:219 start_codon:yes stop_codon:yes gene_type:complete
MNGHQETFYLVWRRDGAAPTKPHASIETARDEACRLAELNPGMEFIVLKALSGHTLPEQRIYQTNYGKQKNG